MNTPELRFAEQRLKASTALPSFTLADLAGQQIEPRSWLWDQIIPSSTLTLLSGEGGIGKTLLLLIIAMAVATGSTLFGRPTRQGPVLLITAEDPRAEIHRRVAAIAGAMGIELSALGDVHVITLIDLESALLAERKGPGSIEWRPLMTMIEAKVSTIGPTLLAFDPASELFGGDENNKAEVAAFAGRLRRLAFRSGAAVVLSIHPSVAGLEEDSGRSGSVAWANSARSRLFLKAGKGGALELHVTKTNFGKKGKVFDLEFRDGAIVQMDEKPPEVIEEERDRLDGQVLKAIDRAATRGLALTHTMSRTSASVVLAKEPALAGTQQRAVFEAIDRLIGAGMLELRGVGPPSDKKFCLFRVESASITLRKPPEVLPEAC